VADAEVRHPAVGRCAPGDDERGEREGRVMNKGQRVIAGLLAVIAVELLPVTIIGSRAVMGGVEVTYEVDDDELNELESELNEAEEVAKRDMNND